MEFWSHREKNQTKKREKDAWKVVRRIEELVLKGDEKVSWRWRGQGKVTCWENRVIEGWGRNTLLGTFALIGEVWNIEKHRDTPS